MEQKFDFVKDDDETEAARRAEQFQSKDPFPSVPLALLSSAEIYDYVRVTAMLHPFHENNLKSASYQARAGGKYLIWKPDGKRETKEVKIGQPIILPRNSISFVQTEPTFRLPNYIAIRFNLRITHVHRGLLLGTGPLVDPGFQGKIFIPLHNLTDSDYEFRTEEGLIWIEFTKTTFDFKPTEKHASEIRHFQHFPSKKCDQKPEDYIEKASGGNPIRSSLTRIEEASDRAENNSKNAEEIAKKTERNLRNIGLAAAIVAALALAPIFISGYSLVMDSITLSASISGEVTDVKLQTQKIQNELEKIKVEIQRIKPSGAQVIDEDNTE